MLIKSYPFITYNSEGAEKPIFYLDYVIVLDYLFTYIVIGSAYGN